MRPLERHDFAEPAAGKHQQPNGVHRRLRFRFITLRVAQRFTEAREFIIAQKSLAFALDKFLDMSARIAAVGAEALHLRQIKHFGQYAERPIGLIGDVL